MFMGNFLYVTEVFFSKFVEDVLRDIVLNLENNEIINCFEVEIEAQESIHNHNAWAYQKKTKN